MQPWAWPKNMVGNLEFLLLGGFLQTAGTTQKSVSQFVPIMQHTVSGKSGYS